MTAGLDLKGDVVNDALRRLTISGITSEPDNQERAAALLRLEMMMDELDSRNIVVGYVFEDNPDFSTPTNVQPAYFNAMSSNLAIRLVDDYGKEIPRYMAVSATQSMSNMSARTAIVNMTDYPNRQPRGSGSTLRYNRWQRYYRQNAGIDTENELPVTTQNNEFVVPDYV